MKQICMYSLGVSGQTTQVQIFAAAVGAACMASDGHYNDSRNDVFFWSLLNFYDQSNSMHACNQSATPLLLMTSHYRCQLVHPHVR